MCDSVLAHSPAFTRDAYARLVGPFIPEHHLAGLCASPFCCLVSEVFKRLPEFRSLKLQHLTLQLVSVTLVRECNLLKFQLAALLPHGLCLLAVGG
jgi:hypothetical protein